MTSRRSMRGISVYWTCGAILLAIAALAAADVPPAAGVARVLSTSPTRGEELAVDGFVELVFNRPMDAPSVEAAFSLSPEVKGAFHWLNEATVRFAPDLPWERGASVVVTVSDAARDADGAQLADSLTLRLQVVGFLRVTQVIPAADATEIAADSVITVFFNRPVVALASVSAPDAPPSPHPLVLEPAVAGSGEWLGTSIYAFTPASPMLGGTRYTATVKAGLADTTGGLLTEDVRWSFTTVRPHPLWTSPDDGETLVSLTAGIRIAFNMPMDAASAADRLSVRPTSLFGALTGSPLPGTIAAVGSSLVFTPSEPLAFDRLYLVTLEPGIAAASGGLGTTDFLRFQFRTVPSLRITGTAPRDGEKDVYPYTAFILEFSAPVDPDSVLERVTIEPAPEPSSIHGWFNEGDLRYVVSFDVKPSQAYTVRVTPGILDPYGNETDQTLTVRFTTDRLDPSAWLHVPGSVGTYSSFEPARIVAAHRNTDRLSLTLTRLEVADYFDALADGYRWTPPARGRVRSWSVAVTTPQNEFGFTAIDLAEGGAALRPGLYAIEMHASGADWNRWQHRHLLVVTPAHLVVKTSRDETLVWATHLESGKPEPGLILWAMDADGDVVDVDVTDSRGLAHFQGSASTDWRGLTILSRSPFALADAGWTDGISPWEFGYSSETSPPGRAYLDTDREIYRAGQTVYYRGVLRDEQDAAYRLPEAREARITITDSRWNVVFDESTVVDDAGEVAGQFDLGVDAPLGTYTLRVRLDGLSESRSFEVAAYRAPEFDVAVRTQHAETAKGEPVRAEIQTTYYFGAPLADAGVEWRVLSEPFVFSPAAFGQYTFTDVDDPWVCLGCWWREPTPPSSILTGIGRTDDAGSLAVELPADIGALPLRDDGLPATDSRRLTLEATAMGRDGSSISGRTSFLLHQASFYAGLASDRAMGRAGEEMPIRTVTLDWAGERLGGIPLRFEIFLREWDNVFTEDEAGGGTWSWSSRDTLVASGDLVSDDRGDGAFSFAPAEGGSYKVVVVGLDERERTVRASRFVWVSGASTVAWRRASDDRVTLIADKTVYEVGETAEILIPSPYPGEQWALVTIERSGVLSQEVVLLPTNSSVLSIPLRDEHIPNVYVGVVLVQGSAAAAAAGAPPTAGMNVGYASLTVRPTSRLLDVTIESAAIDPQPGDAVDVTLSVRDEQGQPVAGRFAVDIVDKAILSLQPREANRILGTFFGERGLGVTTSSSLVVSLSRLVLERLEDLDVADEGAKYSTSDRFGAGTAAPMATSGMMREAEDASSASPLPPGIAVREEFADTAYWNPLVDTDAEGRATLTVELPDNLTTWVVRAVGATAETRVGEGAAEIVVSKPLLVRPVAPRFFVVGDRVRLAASVTNQTAEELSVEVTLGSVGVGVEGPAKQTLAIPARSESQALWWVTVLDVPYVDLAWSASAGPFSDAARPRLTTGPNGTIPVYRYTAPETVGTAGELRTAGTRTELITLPASFDAGNSRVDVRLDVSLAAAMREGLRYLEHFEYECTEQVVSRFLPNALTYRALSLLGVEDPSLAEPLRDLVLEGLGKLYQRQNSDGGWGWWQGESSNAHLSAYVTYALLQVREADVVVRDDVLTRAARFLRGTLVTTDDLGARWEANRQAWVLYVLSLAEVDDAVVYARDLFDRREKLSHYARAYLALALHRFGEPRGATDAIVADLFTSAIVSATGAHWEEPSPDAWAMNTDTRSTAIILYALVTLDPQNPLLPNVVRWLMVARKGGIWETTQENAWALVALTDWMVSTGELTAEYAYGALWDGDSRLSGEATPQTVRDSASLTLSGDDLANADRHLLSIYREEGPGILYYTTHLSLQLPARDVPALSRGIVVSRQYVPLGCAVGTPCEDLASAAVGEEFEVRLTVVAPNDLYYVVVEDPFPAGCEAVDTTLATTSVTALSPGLSREPAGRLPWWGWWWQRWYSRSELRDEKVVLFAAYLPAGTYNYRYTVRAVQPGEYNVIPTVAREFYFPEVFGRADGRSFTVTAVQGEAAL